MPQFSFGFCARRGGMVINMSKKTKRSPQTALILIAAGLISLTIGVISLILMPVSEDSGVLIKIFFSGVWVVAGLYFLYGGFKELSKAGKVKDARRRLMKTGFRIAAEIVEIARDTNININGQCPYYIVCRYAENGAAHVFRSENVMNNPEWYLVDNRVAVWVNANDFNDYYVDMDALFGQD